MACGCIRYARAATSRRYACRRSSIGMDAAVRPAHFDVHGGAFVVTGPDDATVAAGMERARRRIAFYGSTRTYMQFLALHG